MYIGGSFGRVSWGNQLSGSDRRIRRERSVSWDSQLERFNLVSWQHVLIALVPH